MKKFLSIFVAALLMLGVVGQVHAATPGHRQSHGVGDILGQKKLEDEPHKIFRKVRYVPVTYSGATTLAADSIVVWSLTEDDGITVTTTTTSSDSAVAGIIVTQALTPDTDGNTAAQDRGGVNWTWLQTYGLSQVNLIAGGVATAAGDAMGTSTTAGEAIQHVGDGNQTSNRARNQGVAGFFYDASTAGADDVEVFLKGID